MQGFIGSHKYLGLVFKDQLISLVSYGVPRYNKNYDWELHRYCTKPGYSITGGFSKMMKKIEEGTIITYSDARIFSGKVYERNGFEKKRLSSPNYFYTKNYTHIESRHKFQKKHLHDQSLTEWENMQLLGYDRLWDCGNYVYIKKSP